MSSDPESLDSLTQRIIGCAIAVHRELGPGLLEGVYRECMAIELQREKLRCGENRYVRLKYKGKPIRGYLKLDLIVEERVIVELKAVETLHSVHQSQVLTYLKLTGCPAGLLINFNATTIRAGLKRLVHPDLYRKKALTS